MMNLSPLRYRNILSEVGGPIKRLEVGRLECAKTTLYQANAYLSDSLELQTRAESAFIQADGCGTHQSAMVARHMAISEALERWALYHLYKNGDLAAYGLDIDLTSTGMAAFPGLFKRQSRAYAHLEAVERYCLAMWSIGELPGKVIQTGIPDVSAFEIHNPLGRDHVLITWRKYSPEIYAYGFASGRNVPHALLKAQIEMERLSMILRQFHLAHPNFKHKDLSSIDNPLEKRVLNFSLPTGHQTFLSQMDQSLNLPERSDHPDPVIDCPLPGPWDQYTTVWRVLYPMPAAIYEERNPDIFYW